jgi:hypothetical protein
MIMNEQTVFVRTEAGQQAVRGPQSELPRSVRTLLFSIDGRSAAGSYVTLLPNFGNVYALLDFLHQAGYIAERRPSRRRSAAAPTPAQDSRQHSRQHSQQHSQPNGAPSVADSRFAASQPAVGDTSTVVRPSAHVGVGGLLRKMFSRKPRVDDKGARFDSPSQDFAASSLQSPSSQPGPAVAADSRQPSFSGGSSFYPTTTAVTELPPLQPKPNPEPEPEPEVLQFDFPAPGLTQHAEPEDHEAARLQAARELMADFLYAYLPAIAHDACLSINALQTRQQMLASLADYSQLVSRTGEMGVAHLAQLHVTLGWD